jgi:hypothetical protein
VNSDSIDIQSGIPVLSDNTFYSYNDLQGIYRFDLSILYGLFNPTLTASEVETKLNLECQLQIREIESGVTLSTWETIYNVSHAAFNQFILIHSTNRNAVIEGEDNRFRDCESESRIWKNYTKAVTYLASSANKSLSGYIKKKEYSNNKTLLSSTNTSMTGLVNGLNAFEITITNPNTRFIQLFESVNSSEINLTVYETKGDETEYYLTWLSDKGTIRNWLFSAVNETEIDYETEIIVENNYRQIPTTKEEIILLSSKGMSKKDIDYIKSLFGSNFIKVENQSQVIECVMNDNRISFNSESNTYDVTLELKLNPVITQMV